MPLLVWEHTFLWGRAWVIVWGAEREPVWDCVSASESGHVWENVLDVPWVLEWEYVWERVWERARMQHWAWERMTLWGNVWVTAWVSMWESVWASVSDSLWVSE